LGLSSAPLRVGAEPVALTYGAGHLWVANRRDNTVQAIDPVQLPSAPLKSDPTPRALLAMNDRLWVSSDSALRSLRLTDGQWGPTIPLTSPTSMTQDGRRLWVVSSRSPSGTLAAIDPTSNAVTLERTFDWSISKVLFAQHRLWAATDDGLKAVDPTTLAILSNTPVTPRDMIFDGKQLWICDWEAVRLIDPESGVVRNSIPAGYDLVRLAFDGTRLWTISYPGESSLGILVAIDPATGKSENFDFGGSHPFDLIFDGRYLWIAYSSDNRVQAIDPVTQMSLVTIPVGNNPMSLVFDGKRIWVVNRDDSNLQAIYPTPRE
jgi:YVTN family beta-propeller protein